MPNMNTAYSTISEVGYCDHSQMNFIENMEIEGLEMNDIDNGYDDMRLDLHNIMSPFMEMNDNIMYR